MPEHLLRRHLVIGLPQCLPLHHHLQLALDITYLLLHPLHHSLAVKMLLLLLPVHGCNHFPASLLLCLPL
jgi:hypothetical protein